MVSFSWFKHVLFPKSLLLLEGFGFAGLGFMATSTFMRAPLADACNSSCLATAPFRFLFRKEMDVVVNVLLFGSNKGAVPYHTLAEQCVENERIAQKNDDLV